MKNGPLDLQASDLPTIPTPLLSNELLNACQVIQDINHKIQGIINVHLKLHREIFSRHYMSSPVEPRLYVCSLLVFFFKNQVWQDVLITSHGRDLRF